MCLLAAWMEGEAEARRDGFCGRESWKGLIGRYVSVGALELKCEEGDGQRIKDV